MICEHRWWRNFMLINTHDTLTKNPLGAAAEHLCVDCGLREWEVITRDEYEKRKETYHQPHLTRVK